MPFYDYKCSKCREIFEVQKGMNDQTEPKCPACGSQARRVFQTFSVKGSAINGQSNCSSCNTGGCSSCGHG